MCNRHWTIEIYISFSLCLNIVNSPLTAPLHSFFYLPYISRPPPPSTPDPPHCIPRAESKQGARSESNILHGSPADIILTVPFLPPPPTQNGLFEEGRIALKIVIWSRISSSYQVWGEHRDWTGVRLESIYWTNSIQDSVFRSHQPRWNSARKKHRKKPWGEAVLFLFLLHCFNATGIHSALISETRTRFITKQKNDRTEEYWPDFNASCALQTSRGKWYFFFLTRQCSVINPHCII